MPGLDTRRWLICYAATVLIQSELPVPLEELFPAYTNAAGNTRVLGRKMQRAIVDGMVKNRYAEVKKIDGVDHYVVGSCSHKLYSIAVAEDEVGDMAEVFGMSEGEMRMMRYSSKEAERRAKILLAIRAIKKLIAAKKPLARTDLMLPRKGDKFEHRAAWTITWQTPFLMGLVDAGFIKCNPGKPATWEAVNIPELEKLAAGLGNPCLRTLIWPDDPCPIDHSQEPEKAHYIDASPASQPELPSTEEVPEGMVMVKVPTEHVSAVKQMVAEHQEQVAAEEKVEQLEHQLEVVTKTVDVHKAAREVLKEQSEPDTQLATIELLMKVMDCLQSHTKSHTLILDAFSKMTTAVAELKEKVEDLTGEVNTAEDAAIQMQKKQEEAHEEFANYGNQLSQIRKRLSDLEKSVNDANAASSRHQETVKKGVAEVAAQLAQYVPEKTDLDPLVQAIEGLRAEVSRVASKPQRPKLPRALLDKLNSAVDELGAVRDLALDVMPDKKTA